MEQLSISAATFTQTLTAAGIWRYSEATTAHNRAGVSALVDSFVSGAAAAAPDLTITKSHSGNFTQGQTGATYTITVTNSGSVATNGTVRVSR